MGECLQTINEKLSSLLERVLHVPVAELPPRGSATERIGRCRPSLSQTARRPGRDRFDGTACYRARLGLQVAILTRWG
jgi:hypothetical protein